MTEDNIMKIEIISPDEIFYQGEAVMAEFNTIDGEIGIYKNHIPTTVIIAPGVLRLTGASGDVKKADLHAGFAQILQESITILAESPEWRD